ncbi:hypothetical protein D3C76_1644270 [compost metagenome]
MKVRIPQGSRRLSGQIAHFIFLQKVPASIRALAYIPQSAFLANVHRTLFQ